VAVSTVAVLVVVSTGEASAVAPSTAVVVSVGDVSAALSTALAFVVAVLVGAITDSLMMSSSAATAIRGGGAGAIRTDITVTDITRTITTDTEDTHTVTMDMEDTHTAIMDTADTVTMVEPVMDTAMAADQGISGVCGVGDKPGYGSLKSPRLLVRVEQTKLDASSDKRQNHQPRPRTMVRRTSQQPRARAKKQSLSSLGSLKEKSKRGQRTKRRDAIQLLEEIMPAHSQSRRHSAQVRRSGRLPNAPSVATERR